MIVFVNAALRGVFFVSGAAALVFETLLFRRTGLVVGNSVWASTLVLASFMAGLALGNALAGRLGGRVRRPFLAYAFAEILVGIGSFALISGLPFVIPLTTHILRHADAPAALNGVRLLLSFCLLLLPAAAMGTTLPLVVEGLHDRTPTFGPNLGLLYGWNTLGAVAGALASEVWLIPRLGMVGSASVGACMNLAAAVVAASLSRRVDSLPEAAPRVEGQRLGRRAWALLAAAFLAGANLLALEVVWFRLSQQFTLATSQAFAAMLASVLMGIAAGGLAAGVWLRRDPMAGRWGWTVASAAGLAVVVTYSAYPATPALRLRADLLPILQASLRLMVPTSLASGAMFTLIGSSLQRQLLGAARSAGLLTTFNTMGAMTGAFLGGFVVLPGLGVERGIFALAASYAVVAVLLAADGWSLSPSGLPGRVAGWSVAIAYGFSLILFPFGLMKNHFHKITAHPFTAVAGAKVVSVEEGLVATTMLIQRDLWGEPMDHRLLTNGYSMSASTFGGRRYMNLFVNLPMAIHPEARRALLICYGLGTTAKALTQTPSLTSIDIVDIAPEAFHTAPYIFPSAGENPLADPRTRIRIEDGRYHLMAGTEGYDLITGEPPPLALAGVANLYGREFFALMKRRLNPGGVASYWLPVYQLGGDQARAVVSAFCSVFEDCSLWTGFGLEWILVGTRESDVPVAEQDFSRQWHDPSTLRTLKVIGVETPEQLGTLFIADAQTLREFVSGQPPLDDDHPGRLRRVTTAPATEYASFMDFDTTRRRFAVSQFIRQHWPPELAARSASGFEVQGAINRIFLPLQGVGKVGLAELHFLLTRSSVSTPILWLMGTDQLEVDAAHRARERGLGDPTTVFQFAAEAMAHREYLRAESLLAASEAYRPGDELPSQLRVLALCLAGERARAEQLFNWTASGSVKDPAQWGELARLCRLSAPSIPVAAVAPDPATASHQDR